MIFISFILYKNRINISNETLLSVYLQAFTKGDPEEPKYNMRIQTTEAEDQQTMHFMVAILKALKSMLLYNCKTYVI